jgi:regulator of protease activity HflC (stomatin/prohibitin superfamily)
MYELNLKSLVVLIVTALFLITGGVGSCMYVAPKYNVWKQEMDGKAEFAKAEQNRKIKIEEAKANLEAEKLNAQAEIERAKGAAEAIRIENGSITPAYIQYLWVRQQNANTNNKIIYIPTEAGLPVLEAGRVAYGENK